MGVKLKAEYEQAVRCKAVPKFLKTIREGLKKKHITTSDFNVREVFEQTVEGGEHYVRDWRDNLDFSGRQRISEAGVSTAGFIAIMGQLLVNRTMDAYEAPGFIGSKMVETVKSNLPRGERIPGLTQIGDDSEEIGENQPYPYVGIGQDWIDTPEAVKRGMIIGLTRELVAQDLTGQLYSRCDQIGTWMGYNKEIRVLNALCGITSLYNRRSAGITATYQSSGAYINSGANTLLDWRSLETTYKLWDKMTDPNIGTPINVIGMGVPITVIVPTALYLTAERINSATQVRTWQDGAASPVATYGGNPLGGKISVQSSQLVSTVTGNDTTWFAGIPNKAVKYMEIAPIQVVQAPPNNIDEFTRDVVSQWKASEWGTPAVVEPRFLTKNT